MISAESLAHSHPSPRRHSHAGGNPFAANFLIFAPHLAIVESMDSRLRGNDELGCDQ